MMEASEVANQLRQIQDALRELRSANDQLQHPGGEGLQAPGLKQWLEVQASQWEQHFKFIAGVNKYVFIPLGGLLLVGGIIFGVFVKLDLEHGDAKLEKEIAEVNKRHDESVKTLQQQMALKLVDADRELDNKLKAYLATHHIDGQIDDFIKSEARRPDGLIRRMLNQSLDQWVSAKMKEEVAHKASQAVEAHSKQFNQDIARSQQALNGQLGELRNAVDASISTLRQNGSEAGAAAAAVKSIVDNLAQQLAALQSWRQSIDRDLLAGLPQRRQEYINWRNSIELQLNQLTSSQESFSLPNLARRVESIEQNYRDLQRRPTTAEATPPAASTPPAGTAPAGTSPAPTNK